MLNKLKLIFLGTVLILSSLHIGLLINLSTGDDEQLGARTQDNWIVKNGTHLKTSRLSGYNILINGINKYLNFNSISGFSGYGFRDNAGTIEAKDSGGSWTAVLSGSGLNATAFSATAPLTISTTSSSVLYEITLGSSIQDGYMSTSTYALFDGKADVAGADTQLQYNNGGILGAGAFLTTNKSSSLTIDGGGLVNSVFNINGSINSYIRSTAADLFQLGHGGSAVLTIDATNQVGIGTTTPVSEFEVVGTSTFTAIDVTGKSLTVDGDTIYHSVGFVTDAMTEDKQDISLRVSGGNVYLDVEKTGGGNVEYIFDENEYILDATTGAGAGGKATILLTEGTATTPVRNYIYAIPNGTAVDLVATTVHPHGFQLAWVGIVTIQSDAEVTTEGGLLFQRTNDSLKHDGRGKLSEFGEKLRFLGAEYLDGVDQTLTVTTNALLADNVILTLNTGTIFQLHPQDFPSYDMAVDGLYVANASGLGTLTKYQKITDINQLLEDSNGVAIVDKDRAVFTIFCNINSASQQKCFVNLPRDFYTKNDRALADRDNFAVTTAPPEFKTTAFLVAKLVLKYRTTNSGTWTNLSGGTAVQDLRGVSIGFNLGGAGGNSSNTFDDSLFMIFDNLDATKEIAFEASGISAGTTRTLTVQDSNGTLAYVNNQTFTGMTTVAELIVTASTTFNGVEYLFPVADGTNGYVLSTDGAGGLSWIAAGVGDITSVFNITSGAVDNPVLTSSHSIDASSADFLRLPVDDTVASSGSITVDATNDDQLRYYGDGVNVLTGFYEKCFTVASSSIAFFEDAYIWHPRRAITIQQQVCRVQSATSLVMNISDGTNDMDSITCATTITKDASLSNNTFTADEGMTVEFGTQTGNVDSVNYCIQYNYDSD